MFIHFAGKMLRLLILLVTLGGCLLASSPDHLKPGALTHHLGQVFLVEEVLIARYPLTPLLSTMPTVKLVSDKLTSIAESINATKDREDMAPSTHYAQNTLELLWDRVVFLQEKVEKAYRDYSLHPVHAKEKRGLLNIVGKTSKFLFGTATDDDVRDLREHYNQLLSYAAQNRRVINLNCRKINRLQAHLDKLLSHTNKLTTVMNTALRRLDQLGDFILMDQALQVMEQIINAVLKVNEEIISNMVDAVHNKVTPSLLPVHDLEEIIKIGHRNYSFQPLYPTLHTPSPSHSHSSTALTNHHDLAPFFTRPNHPLLSPHTPSPPTPIYYPCNAPPPSTISHSLTPPIPHTPLPPLPTLRSMNSS